MIKNLEPPCVCVWGVVRTQRTPWIRHCCSDFGPMQHTIYSVVRMQLQMSHKTCTRTYRSLISRAILSDVNPVAFGIILWPTQRYIRTNCIVAWQNKWFPNTQNNDSKRANSTDKIMCMLMLLLTMPTAVAGLGFSPAFVCLSVYPHDISKNDAAKITKLDIQMFHHESRKPVHLGVKRWKVKVTSHNNSAGVGHCTLVSSGFF